ncbi:type I polyketide synthase [Streptomyces huiliensis]|uniref:type I polyketide synthase n=1 Tax=Streptomyces huiliensis TaxID=2876027 RepID=UPI001CBE4B16|nr:type I polyketide synthase [Streptomyces huiliensis]MBZ4320498.1 SDR family NAD(P)-dependent oxidoreductase [Streptomyces huiliensis]
MAGSDAVAVVGVGCRLPGGIRSLDALWETLAAGRDTIGEVPPERFDASSFTGADVPCPPGLSYTSAGGFLEDDPALFDADYFRMSPKEASRVDPQQRLLLECAVEALDDAGLDAAGLAGGDTAVVMGACTSEHFILQQRRLRTMNAYTMSGGAGGNTANRISHFLDVRGPSLAVDTACSSGLTAVHTACEQVRSGRSALALAGGVNVLLGPGGFVGFSQASMLSPTGRCRPFSAAADGFVRAEGAGVLVLKPLAAALADGDRVHAVIVASGMNADGRTAGLPMPSAQAQAALLRDVYERAGIAPEEVAYVEAHGTGTQVGDPVECEALGAALGRHRADGGLPIGSLKPNLGHLEAASGIAGLLKGLLVLREGRIPATLHAEPLNDAIDFAGLGLAPVTTDRPLPRTGRGLVGVNSFGFGGANTHVVLAPAPVARGTVPHTERLPVLVSARTPEALAAAAGAWADRLADAGPDAFYDLAFTSFRRTRHEHRLALLADGPREAADALRTAARGEPDAACASAVAVRGGRTAFVFCGGGANWVGMGRELLATDQAFTAEAAAVDEELTHRLGWSVLEEMAHPDDPERWDRTEVAQPLLFAVQAGLVAALAARGITPAAVTGHSVGEVAAAYCAGALDRAAACRVIVERGKAQAMTAGSGRMAAVGLGEEEAVRLLEDRCPGRLVVAAVNSDRDVTVAGDAGALAALGAELTAEGVFFRDIGLDYAFHTAAMDPLRDAVKSGLAGLAVGDGRLPVVSGVTGERVESRFLDADYWWSSLREPVRFSRAVAELTGPEGCDALVEIGPHPVLATYLRRAAAPGTPVAVVPTLRRTDAGPAALDRTEAHLLAAGATGERRYFPRPGRVVTTPAYPWQRERHWNGEPSWWYERATEAEAGPSHPLLGHRQPTALPTWSRRLAPGGPRWLADHTVGGAVVLPASAFLELALAAGEPTLGGPVEATRLAIRRSVTVPSDSSGTELVLDCSLSPQGEFTVATRRGTDGEWVEHARCRVRRLLRDRPPALDAAAVARRLPGHRAAEAHYAAAERTGVRYGPAFRPLTGLRTGDGEVLASYAADPGTGTGYLAHPALLDGALQAVLPLAQAALGERMAFLPIGFEAVRCWQPLPTAGTVHVRTHAAPSQEPSWSLTIAGEDGTVALELLGIRAQRFDAVPTAPPSRLTEVLRAAPLPGPAAPSEGRPPADVLAAAAPGLTALTARWHAHPYARGRASAMEISAHCTAAAVAGLLPDRERFTIEDLLLAGALPRHVRLLRTLLATAAEYGLFTAEDGGWRRAADPDPHRVLQDAVRTMPAAITTFHTHAVCGLRLAGVLRGECDPLELLFFGPDPLAARYYDADGINRYHGEVARLLVRALSAGRPADRPLRVLEVGAGTGGTTALILPELPPGRCRYVYTDVSAVFFPQARHRFRDFPFLTCRRLDLTADPAEQGFEDGSFDLVIAANSLHTAHDPDRALSHVHRLLADDGHLLALESHHTPLVAPVFGLLDSFWPAGGTAPLLAYEEWQSLLERNGFTGTVRAGDPEEPARGDQSVLLAARHPRPPCAPAPAPADGRRRLLAPLYATGDDDGILAALRSRLTPGTVSPAEAGTDPGAWAEYLGAGTAPVDVLLTAGADDGPAAERAGRALHGCAVLRALADAALRLPREREVTVWLVLHGDAFDERSVPGHAGAGAALWGAARSLANEHPRLRVRRVALCTAGDGTEVPAGRLADELLACDDGNDADEDEVVLTPGGRFVPRVVPLPPYRRPSSGPGLPRGSYSLMVENPGLRYRLGWAPCETPVPGPGEVVVEVAAVGLNYRDVLTVTGLVPMPTTAVGLECAGTVTAVGPGVRHPAPGDRVMGMSNACLGTHARCRADRVVPVPDTMTFAEAATLLCAFLTVQHGLGHLARLAAGERVLVHGGAGGVGLAALQYARRAGARVTATAGTPAKRDLLRLLGAEHVLDSRGLRFADQVLEVTGGEGVDIVLNSLAGEAMTRGLDVLRPEGRFVELGKRDLLDDNALPLGAFEKSLSYFVVGVFPWATAASPRADAHLAALRDAVHHGDLRPLPLSTYPAHRVREAFACLQHSRHIGKVVVTFDPDEPVSVTPPAAPPPLDARATYLITGGLSGLGAATARHLARRGARHLTLVGRRGTGTPEGPALLDDLAEAGAEAAVHAVDASDVPSLRGVLDAIDTGGRRLAGVVHAAMVLDDAPLTDLTDERLRAVLAPKMTAGLLLDDLTRHRDLDFFVTYSSAAALAGNLRQTPYAAGNLALDAMVRARRRAGLPGLSVRWGALDDVGFVRRARDTGRTVVPYSVTTLSSEEALAELDALLARPDVDVVTVGRFDWDRAAPFLHTLSAPRTAGLLPDEKDTAGVPGTVPSDPARAADVLAELLARVLHTAPDRVDRTRPLEQMGMDSLTASELAVLIRQRFGRTIPTMELLGTTTPAELVGRLLARHAEAAR